MGGCSATLLHWETGKSRRGNIFVIYVNISELKYIWKKDDFKISFEYFYQGFLIVKQVDCFDQFIFDLFKNHILIQLIHF